ncbi:MAG: hypothetical protein P9L89_08865, partial [Candidatus Celaenobacter polaris]|nr:hypothetical protein [Candidatus Celaenobacter polaris]
LMQNRSKSGISICFNEKIRKYYDSYAYYIDGGKKKGDVKTLFVIFIIIVITLLILLLVKLL